MVKPKYNPSTDDSPYGWLIGPASNLVFFIAEEMTLAGVTERALSSYSTLPILLRASKHAMQQRDIAANDAFDMLEKYTTDDAAFAKAEVENGFDTLFKHHCIALWAAIETNVENTLFNLIERLPDARDTIIASLSNPTDRQIKIIQNKSVKRAFDTWQPMVDAIPAMERYLKMLQVLSIEVLIPNHSVEALDELAAIRNAVMHNGGFVDQKFLEKCPLGSYEIDDLISIDHNAASRFFDAASEFTKSFLNAMVVRTQTEIEAKT